MGRPRWDPVFPTGLCHLPGIFPALTRWANECRRCGGLFPRGRGGAASLRRLPLGGWRVFRYNPNNLCPLKPPETRLPGWSRMNSNLSPSPLGLPLHARKNRKNWPSSPSAARDVRARRRVSSIARWRTACSGFRMKIIRRLDAFRLIRSCVLGARSASARDRMGASLTGVRGMRL
jgi:hypothetical protein